MANLNIPANPNVGDTYEENGVTYTWTGTHWTASVTETYASGPLAGFRNMIINGNMIIAQRGEGPATNSGYVTADRWSFGSNVESQVVGLATAVTNTGITNMLRATSTDVIVNQAVEMPFVAGGPRSQLVIGEQYTISLLALDATDAISVNVRYADGSGGGNMVDAATDTGFVAMTADNLAGGLTQYTRTFTIGNNVPAASNRCILVSFNLTASTGTVVQFGNVQLEPGPVATPFEHRPPGTELALCQRYFLQMNALSTSHRLVQGQWSDNSTWESILELPTTMRTAPTSFEQGPGAGLNDNFLVTVNGQVADADGDISAFSIAGGPANGTGVRLNIAHDNTPATAGSEGQLRAKDDNRWIRFNCEL